MIQWFTLSGTRADLSLDGCRRQDPPQSAKESFEQFENLNVATLSAHAAVVAQLSKQLREFFDSH